MESALPPGCKCLCVLTFFLVVLLPSDMHQKQHRMNKLSAKVFEQNRNEKNATISKFSLQCINILSVDAITIIMLPGVQESLHINGLWQEVYMAIQSTTDGCYKGGKGKNR